MNYSSTLGFKTTNSNTMKHILITGGTGLIGTEITAQALKKGYAIRILTRSPKPSEGNVSYAFWNPSKGEIAPDALQNIDYIIHLAGENIGDKSWSESRKKAILDSRIESTNTLLKGLAQPNTVTKIMVASAIGFYGNSESSTPFVETDGSNRTGFAAEVAYEWEKELDKLSTLGKTYIKGRVGIVLGNKGGAFPQMYTPAKMGVGYLGDGKQVFSWIHLTDLAASFLYLLENTEGNETFNLVAPNPASYQVFSKTLSKVIKMPILLPFVPAFIIRIVLGEMSNLVLNGATISSKKLSDKGFKFHYPTLSEALTALTGK
jgi:uncharacterized protein (TIGR01777 family)